MVRPPSTVARILATTQPSKSEVRSCSGISMVCRTKFPCLPHAAVGIPDADAQQPLNVALG